MPDDDPTCAGNGCGCCPSHLLDKSRVSATAHLGVLRSPEYVDPGNGPLLRVAYPLDLFEDRIACVELQTEAAVSVGIVCPQQEIVGRRRKAGDAPLESRLPHSLVEEPSQVGQNLVSKALGGLAIVVKMAERDALGAAEALRALLRLRDGQQLFQRGFSNLERESAIERIVERDRLREPKLAAVEVLQRLDVERLVLVQARGYWVAAEREPLFPHSFGSSAYWSTGDFSHLAIR